MKYKIEIQTNIVIEEDIIMYLLLLLILILKITAIYALSVGIGRSAIEVGVGHHPDLESCHANCEASNGCGDHGICQCKCCGYGNNQDGCYCYFCAPLGLPISPFSQHQKSVLKEPTSCPGSKQMCGGMFGSTVRVSKAVTNEASLSQSKRHYIENIMRENNSTKKIGGSIGDRLQKDDHVTISLKLQSTRFRQLDHIYRKCLGKVNDIERTVTKLDYLMRNDLDPKLTSLRTEVKKLKGGEIEAVQNNSKGLHDLHKIFSKISHSNLRN